MKYIQNCQFSLQLSFYIYTRIIMAYQFDTIVNRKEADALKDMIFRRVRERSQSMSEDFQSDVMDLARDSFVSKGNPFANIVAEVNKKSEEVAVKSESVEENQREDIGFPIRKPQSRMESQSRLINEQTAKAVVVNTMQEARDGLSNKKSFMGALNFLNTKAAISLTRTRADKFEIMA